MGKLERQIMRGGSYLLLFTTSLRDGGTTWQGGGQLAAAVSSPWLPASSHTHSLERLNSVPPHPRPGELGGECFSGTSIIQPG